MSPTCRQVEITCWISTEQNERKLGKRVGDDSKLLLESLSPSSKLFLLNKLIFLRVFSSDSVLLEIFGQEKGTASFRMHLVVDDPAIFLKTVKILDHFSKTIKIRVNANQFMLQGLDESKQMQVSLNISSETFLLYELSTSASYCGPDGGSFDVKTEDFIDSIQACLLLLYPNTTPTTMTSNQNESVTSLVDRSTLSIELKDPFEILEISSQNSLVSVHSSLSILDHQLSCSGARRGMPTAPDACRWLLSVTQLLISGNYFFTP